MRTQTIPNLPGTEPRRAALYLRVSTSEQDTLLQEDRLREVASRMGYTIVDRYEDAGISGAKGRDQRPELDRMLKDAVRRRFDVVMCWSIDRLGRSLQHLIATLSDLHAASVDIYFDQQAVDTTTPAGRALFQIMGVFAEFERAMIKERVRAGIEKARVHGTRSGRPLGQQKRLTDRKRNEIEAALKEGLSLNEAARKCRMSRSTISRIRRAIR